jgi:hypothetical protein
MKLNYFVQLFVILHFYADRIDSATNNIQLESCVEEKDYKNLLKTRPNLLILFTKTGNVIVIFIFFIIFKKLN